ncbi:hypothetical protein FRC07_005602 [Ceratobasidium sp. 392]|nr:hypothetical protein FRC07_005602 [Ceratobasidium sp. 392]
MTRVAIVTGAAQGIGRAIALRLAADGIDVAVNDIPSKQESLLALVKEIEAGGRKSIAVTGDVSQESEVKGLVAKTVEELGGLDIMVANAGINQRYSILDLPEESFDKILSVNAKGVLFCYRAAAMQMIKQGRGGRIIGASSLLGISATAPNHVSYSTSKFAVRAITQTAALEWGEHKITVNAYAPGFIDTPLVGAVADRLGPDYRQKLSENICFKRLGEPEEVASVVSFLASEGASYITELAKDGIDVAVNDLPQNQQALETLVEEIKAIGRNSAIVVADVSKENEITSMIEETVKTLGSLDIMVANAAINMPQSLLDVSDESFDKVLRVNLKGTLFCYRAAASQMIKQGRGGRIIGASSVWGLKAQPQNVSYNVSKFGIRAITQTAALEWGEHKITVNAYAPGLVDTPMVAASSKTEIGREVVQSV